MRTLLEVLRSNCRWDKNRRNKKNGKFYACGGGYSGCGGGSSHRYSSCGGRYSDGMSSCGGGC